MGRNLNTMELEDLLRRAKPHLKKMYPLLELINGKNIPVNYEFTEAKSSLMIKETQQGDVPKPNLYEAWAILKSQKGRYTKKSLSEVVEYFEKSSSN